MARPRMVDPVQQVRDHAQATVGVRSVVQVARTQREAGRFIGDHNLPRVMLTDELPAAESQYYGWLVIVNGGTGVADGAYVVLRDAADAFYWLNLASSGAGGWSWSQRANGNSGATNNTNLYTPLTTGSLIRTTLTLPTGTWDISGHGQINLRHTANNGQGMARMLIAYGATTSVGEQQPGEQPVLDTRFTVPVGVFATGVPGGTITVGIDFRRVTAGVVTAGTFGWIIVATRTA